LASREGRDDLYPSEPAARARVDMALDRFATSFRSAFFPVEAAALGFSRAGGFGSAPPDPHAAVARAADAAPTIALFDQVVDPSGTWLGTLTIADFAAAPVLYRTTRTGMDMTPYPNLTRMR